MTDAAILRRAALILRSRSRKPDSIWLRAIVRVLDSAAERAEVEEVIAASRPRRPNPSRRGG